jgi:hypothetical protein
MVGFCPPAAVHAPTTQRLLCFVAVFCLGDSVDLCCLPWGCCQAPPRLLVHSCFDLPAPRSPACAILRAQAFGASPLLSFGAQSGSTLSSSANPSGWLAYMKPKARPPPPGPALVSLQLLGRGARRPRNAARRCAASLQSGRACARARRRLRRPLRGRRTRSRSRAPSPSRSPTRPAPPRTSQASARRAPACAPPLRLCSRPVRRRACDAGPGTRSSVTAHQTCFPPALSAGSLRAVTHALYLACYSGLGRRAQVVGGVEVLTITQGAATPKAVVLLFHGCSHSATDWWHASKNCPSCLGAPMRGPVKQHDALGAALRGLLDIESLLWHAHVGRAWLIAAPNRRSGILWEEQLSRPCGRRRAATAHHTAASSLRPQPHCASPGAPPASAWRGARHAPCTATPAPRHGRARRRAALPRARGGWYQLLQARAGLPLYQLVALVAARASGAAPRGAQACRRRWASRARRCGAAGRRSPSPAPTASSAAGTCARRAARRRPRATSPRRAPARRARLGQSLGAPLSSTPYPFWVRGCPTTSFFGPRLPWKLRDCRRQTGHFTGCALTVSHAQCAADMLRP